MSGTRRRIRKENSRDRPRSQLAPKHIATWFEGTAPPFLHALYPPGALLVPHAALYPPVQGPYDMSSSPLGQHILDYEPRRFVIPPFAMYDGSSDPYDHMLHFNQAMILNAGDDRLLCKVFPASLKGPALAWFHKLPRGSINSFGKLWAVFVSSIYAQSGRKGISTPFRLSLNEKTNPSRTSHAGLDKLSNRLIFTVWMWSYKTYGEALDQSPRSSSLYP